MTEKLYYWAENLEGYSSDNDTETDNEEVIEIKRLNFFIGKNNAGKSRFLRNLFISNYPSGFYNLQKLVKNLKILKTRLPNLETQFGYSSSYSNIKHNYKDLIQDLENNKVNQLIYLNSSIKGFLERDNNLKGFFEDYSLFEISDEEIVKISGCFLNRFYIPILRGMRPVTNQENKQPYIERAQKDYFPNRDKFNSKNIITGECLYHELKIHLLGEPEQRELIKSYEEKLSQYFFDNEAVSLIPKHDQDVVNIKIGSDKQFSISQLGDGLQQAIILTYEAFIKKDETHAFFVEEPELHMHAGMVRQLMNFYLNETPHYYFFTTHSNHLLDMVDESDEVIIQKFVKLPNADDPQKFDFKIFRCDKDHDLLTSLGVRASSVYLANCTIWVEGVTDRMYLSKLMEKYIQELANSAESENRLKAKKYRSFMPNFHYAFIEYAGGNITHWSFLDDYPTREEALSFLENNKGLTAKAITKNILLLADGDNEDKADRLVEWSKELSGDNVYLLPCKEIENTLDASIIKKACLIKFCGIKDASSLVSLSNNTINRFTQNGFTRDTTKFDISRINSLTSFISADGIGKIIDDCIRLTDVPEKDSDGKDKPLPRLFSDKSGTIDDKVGFCEICKVLMTYEDWQLTEQAKELCEKIFNHIEKCN